MTDVDIFFAARKAYYEAADAVNEFVEREIKIAYKAIRAEDKAAGRDVSGKSVAERRAHAHYVVTSRADVQAKRAEVDSLWRHYRTIAGQS